MKFILQILFVLLSFPVTGSGRNDGEPERGEPATGFIDITVESNVKRLLFSYALSDGELIDKVGSLTPEENSETANISVPVKDFICDNETAFRDFLTLLKADEYPNLEIVIPQPETIRVSPDEKITLHNVVINIAGVSVIYDIICRVENRNLIGNVLVGSVKINLTDLEIVPPVKYFGLVKIKDEVIVNFGLSLKDYSLAFNKDSD